MQRLRRAVRAGMVAAARDETDAASVRSALVVAPHPDDETLGCGAAILRKVAAGTPVTVAVVTDGRHSHRTSHLTPDALAELRRAEMHEAAHRLGLGPDAVRWLGVTDGTVPARESDLAARLAGLIAELRPDDVYATAADDGHGDHAAAGRAARAAVRATDGRVRLLEYPVWLWTSWPLRRGARARSTVDAARRLAARQVVRVRTGAYREAKLHALDAHRSQLRRPAGVPADVAWPVLPPAVLSAAAGTELFFPWRPAGSAH